MHLISKLLFFVVLAATGVSTVGAKTQHLSDAAKIQKQGRDLVAAAKLALSKAETERQQLQNGHYWPSCSASVDLFVDRRDDASIAVGVLESWAAAHGEIKIPELQSLKQRDLNLIDYMYPQC